jgi:hypothetical protein
MLVSCGDSDKATDQNTSEQTPNNPSNNSNNPSTARNADLLRQMEMRVVNRESLRASVGSGGPSSGHRGRPDTGASSGSRIPGAGNAGPTSAASARSRPDAGASSGSRGPTAGDAGRSSSSPSSAHLGRPDAGASSGSGAPVQAMLPPLLRPALSQVGKSLPEDGIYPRGHSKVGDTRPSLNAR